MWLALWAGCSGGTHGGGDDVVSEQSDPPADDGAGDPDAPLDDTVSVDAVSADVSVDSGTLGIGAEGGTVDRLHFAVFGDVRPLNQNDTAHYPSAIVSQVLDGIQTVGAQFAIATGDYMFAGNATYANAQIDLLLAAERAYSGFIFHALGNHECTGSTTSNCPNGSETGNVQAFRTRLVPAMPGLYYDWVVHTSAGDAHFIATAPNAWSSSQQGWLTRVLAQPARYTFVIAHEPPDAQTTAPGATAIEDAIRTRTGGVTLRLYGHTHEYRHYSANAVISGNAGAPLDGTGSYGFVTVDQRADGNVQVTEYAIGRPPTAMSTFALTPAGTTTH